ncbi:hypothetical protein HYH02_012594 [Chlamydomonas schloesseri]|uniref:2'-phosphotransferase n=1 Tax=Chlamydomonas schloesseri TaxID=2026947 RepID=A0A835T8F3_9CHLO|nr:hypothetical protein HYH02_012594 [Chlamydomonas schloesseri]|eukprot:KAG2433476.1 hypothetical protein HYH02_012594 [Chlamydomonas schloesseri]
MKRQRQNEDASTRISKDISRLLRHKPPPGMDASGWLSLPVLLRHLKGQPTEQQVRDIVAACPKKRFVLDDTTSPPRIRAAQGHSVELAEAVLEPVTAASQVPVAVHVTGAEGWSAIQSSGELRRMKRTHVHFATAPHHLRVNKWAEVYLRLDLQAALDSGLQFGLSSNGVLLCEGPVPVALVKQVALDELPQEWRQGRQRRQGQQGQGAGKEQTQQPTEESKAEGGKAEGSKAEGSKAEEMAPAPATDSKAAGESDVADAAATVEDAPAKS